MNRKLYGASIISLLLLLPLLGFGQPLGPHDVWIPQPIDPSVMLNNLIQGDTLGNGARRDTLATYVLQRGAAYTLNVAISNVGWKLRVRAKDSTFGGKQVLKPAIFMIRNTSTSANPGRFVLVGANVSLSNLIVAGYADFDPSFISDINGAIITETVAGFDIVVDSCVFTNSNGNHIRTDGSARVIKVTNSIFANMGDNVSSNLGAGKAIDVRAGSCDSIIMVNNTFVNSMDRTVRHFQSTLNINYFRFEHNNVINSMVYHGLLSLGRMGARGIIANNLFYDATALGHDTDFIRQVEFSDGGELDPLNNSPRMTWVITNPLPGTVWTIKNNYYVVSPAGQAWWTAASTTPIIANPALTTGPWLTYFLNSQISDSVNAFRSTNVTLPAIPNLMTTFMTWYRAPQVPGPGSGKNKNNKSSFTRAMDYDRRPYDYWSDTMNCAYSTGAAIYTAADGSYPVGDLNWFPTRLVAWRSDAVSSVSTTAPATPSTFALAQNYPNPFNPSTQISFVLDKSGFTTLAVYNVLGQKVETLLAQNMTAGEHFVTFNAPALSSGVYFYRLESGHQSAVRKMVLMR